MQHGGWTQEVRVAETHAGKPSSDGGRHLREVAGSGWSHTVSGVIAVVYDHAGAFLAAHGMHRAEAVSAGGLEALRAAIGDKAVVVPGPLDLTFVASFDADAHAADGLLAASLERLARPLWMEGEAHFVQSRVGMATAAAVGTTDAEELARAAFGAAHVAVDTGVHAHVARDGLLASLAQAAEVHTAMASAAREDFEMHYQPIVDLATSRALGYESLLRWRRAGELLTPPSFLSAAEETSLLLPIGRAGTRVALKQVARWNTSSSGEPKFISVNYSARQLSDALLLPVVERTLEELALSPATLWVEITEQALVDFGSPAARTIESLAELGCVICVDDLGTGFTALRYLADLPVSVAKVDRSLVLSASSDASIRSIVGAICDISRSLGIETVAEGVEHAGQIPMLRELGFTHAQGYHFGRPAPAAPLATESSLSN